MTGAVPMAATSPDPSARAPRCARRSCRLPASGRLRIGASWGGDRTPREDDERDVIEDPFAGVGHTVCFSQSPEHHCRHPP